MHASLTFFRDRSEHIGEIAEQVIFSFHKDLQFCALLLNRRIKVLLQDSSSSSFALACYSFLLDICDNFKLRCMELVE